MGIHGTESERIKIQLELIGVEKLLTDIITANTQRDAWTHDQ